METLDLLFDGVTAVTMREDAPVLYNARVGVKGRHIVYMSGGAESGESTKTASPAPAAKRVIDGAHKVLMPALINCHTHAPMSLLRGYANDRSLEDWLFNFIFPAETKLRKPEYIRTGALLAIAEMVASGTVSFTDMYFNMDVIATAVDEAGVKANLSNAVIGFDRDTYDFHKDGVYAETLAVLKDFHNAGGGRVKAEASIHGVYTSYDKAWRQVLDFAREHKLGLHIHLSETKTEQDNCVKTYGMTPAQVFEKHEIFSLPVSAAHCVWVTDGDIDILARHGVSAAHNPVSNLKLASGLAPVGKMLEKGVNVTLGTDGMASNNSHDLFEEIKLASILQKYAENEPTAAPARDVLKMATVNGARAQGRENECGIIKEGFDADLVLLDFDNPRQTVCFDPVVALAYSATGRDVAMTLCQGTVLYENGEYKTIDIERVLYEARRIKEAITGTGGEYF